MNPRSFWIAGFEGADHRNEHGIALDMVRSTGHLARLDGDYARVTRLGLRTVRESIGWRLAETAAGRYDFQRLRLMAAAARRHGLQVLWTLMHYGAPDDVDLRQGGWVPRFTDFAAAVAEELRRLGEEAPVITPVTRVRQLRSQVLVFARAHFQKCHYNSANCSGAAGFPIPKEGLTWTSPEEQDSAA